MGHFNMPLTFTYQCTNRDKRKTGRLQPYTPNGECGQSSLTFCIVNKANMEDSKEVISHTSCSPLFSPPKLPKVTGVFAQTMIKTLSFTAALEFIHLSLFMLCDHPTENLNNALGAIRVLGLERMKDELKPHLRTVLVNIQERSES